MKLRVTISLRACGRAQPRRRRPRAECSVPGREPPAVTALALVELRRRVPLAPKAARTQWCSCTCPSAPCDSSQRPPRTTERRPRVPCSVRGPGASAGPAEQSGGPHARAFRHLVVRRHRARKHRKKPCRRSFSGLPTASSAPLTHPMHCLSSRCIDRTGPR